MSLIEQIISEAKASNIVLYVKDGQLAFIAEKGGFSNELKSKIRQHKNDIIFALLEKQGSSSHRDLAPFALLTEEERALLGEGVGEKYEDAYPMSALQAGMVFHTQLEQFNGIYHDINSEHVKCLWDRNSFEQALTSCIEEHPILRTGFLLEGERPLQVVHRGRVELPLGVEDLREMSEGEQQRCMAEWRERRKRHVFAWESGPLFHIQIFLRTEESFEFVISFHHAVLDGWSRAALGTMLYQRYERLLRGEELGPVEVDWTYREFIAEEQKVLGRQEAREHFAGMLEEAPVEQLPRKKSHSASATAAETGAEAGVLKQGRLQVEGFSEVSGRLIELARQLGVPVQVVLLAAHYKVLSLVSGQKRVVSCVIQNGRPETMGAERSLGLYLNSLPQAVEVKRSSWRELIHQVAELNAASLEYRRYPLAQIQQELGWAYSEVLFNYTHFHIYNELSESAEQARQAGANVLEGLGSTGFEQTNFDLLVDVSRGMNDERMWLALVYNAGVLEEGWMKRLGQYFVRACEQMLEHLEEAHEGEKLLGAEELEQLLAGWNATEAEYRRDACLQELFEEQVERDGEAEAVVYEGQRVSYRELNRRANQVAHYLREQGVKGDTLVGLCVERSVEMVVGILGILKAGGAYVPLDPGYPQERLEYMLEDSGPAVVLTQSWLEEKLGGCRVPVLRLDAEQQKLEQYAETNPERGGVGLTSNHLAYVIYTSGSTGQPKGVMIAHCNVTNFFQGMDAAITCTGSDTLLAVTGFSFDISVLELLWTLTCGARVIIADDVLGSAGESNRKSVAELAAQYQPTLMQCTPSLMRMILEGEELGGFNSLRTMMLGGEALPSPVVEHIKTILNCRVVNMYGPTETTIWSTTGDIDGGVISVGRAIANTELYIVNGNDELAPVGTAGELWIGGEGVARGYFQRQDLTAERFVPSQFSRIPGSRCYRTGDVARYLEDGRVEIIGRNDFQVKIRGHRIELGEIEHRLAAIDGVKTAIVVAKEDGTDQKQLVAYMTLEGQQSSDQEDVIRGWRKELQELLPDYMIPSAFVILEKLPLTPNGKVDRKALPTPESSNAPKAEYVPPRNMTEHVLCAVWQEVLKRERIGIEDNFFSLGGDSILSVRVISILKRRGMVLNVKEIFQYQTIAELAPSVRVTSAGAEYRGLQPFELLTEKDRELVVDKGYEDAYPMSALQTGMVFHTQLEQFSGIYHDIMAEHVKYHWDAGCFEQALATCIEENPILRTGFRLEGERPLQHVHARINLPLEIQDLRPMSAGEQEQHIAEWRERRKRQVFDWERGPLFHIQIFLRTDGSFEFVMSYHHAVLDGWSRASLTTMLHQRYERLLRGELLEPVKVDWTYRDFIAQEQQMLRDSAATAHFRSMLEDAPMDQLPKMKVAGTGSQERLDVEGIRPLSSRLIRLAKQMGVPLQSVLLAAHFKVVSLLSGRRRAMSCVTHNARPETEGAERSLGLYLNPLPICLDVASGTWRELIQRVAEAGNRSMGYRSYPLKQIQQDVGLELSEVTFNYNHFHVYRDIYQNSAQQLEVLGSSGFAQIDFDFHIEVVRGLNDVLNTVLIYNGAKFERELMERMSGYYVCAYEQMLGGLDEPHQGRRLLSGEEEEQIRSWNETAVEYERASVQEQFEQQARRTPEAVAVVCGGRQLSYAELNGKAERLARYLVEAGVERESRVGICLGRSLEMMIGMLGVLKAGGAYVPLEPGLPKVRLQYMLEDAGIEWVLVESTGMEKLPLGGVDVVLMDGAGEDERWLEEVEIGGEGGQGWEKPEVRAEDLAYILYTSGSTGEPKGVMVEHGGLVNYVGHAVAEYLQGGNRASNKDNKGEIAEQGSRGGKEIVGSVVSTPLCFDATLTVLLPPLMVGKRVELLEEGEGVLEQLAERLFAGVERGAKKNKKNVDEKAEDGSESHAGWLFKITPAHLEALEYVERPRAMSEAGHCIVIGGEQLGAQRLLRWKRELLPNAVFVNEYGPTETVVGCSVWKLEDEAGERELEGQVAAPIGKPIGNTELYVVGEGGQLQPVNSVGELWIGGGGVGRGYVGREELTRERFVEDRFSGKEKGRLYRSGDLVRRLNHGELQFVGRRDDQVKVRGYRIELGEIEQQIAGLAGVAGAAVVVREDGGGEKRLVAYIVAEAAAGRQELETGEIRQQLQQRLPEYMVPHVYVRLEKLPLTGNGKVDRKALPAVEGSELQNSQYVGPRNEVERVLCGIWAEVLKRERVGVKDNFFSLGGDSILSIRVVSMLKGQGLVIGIREIFQHQTIEQLAQQVRSSSVETEPKRVEAFGLLTEEERALLGEGGGEKYEDAYPMSALQVGMVFHTQLEQFNGIYHDILSEHVKCGWERNSFEQALAACIEEQPILRTGFLLEGERPLQVVHRGRVELPLGVEDLREMSEGEQQRCMAEWRERRKRHVFAWESGPLFHIQIFLRTEESFEFVISFHHAVLDGWSRAALGTMLYQRYERLLRGEELGPVEVDWTYREFIAEEQKVLGRQEAREHFAGMLEEAPVEQLPRKKSHSASATAAETGAEAGVLKQGRLQVEGFSEVSGRLIELARQLGVPVQVVLLAAHYKVLSLVSGQKRVVSCVIQNGRPETTGAERSLGLYLNSLPQAVEVKRSSWRELIHQVAELNAASLEYRRYPLAQIQQELGWAYSEVLFNYTHFHIYNELSESAEQARQAGANVLEGLGSTGFEQTNFDLLVDVSRGMNDERMWLALVYNAGVLEEGWMKRLGQYFVRACEQMLEHLEEAHEGEKLLGAEELEQLLAGWNATEVEYRRDACLQELFEEQVERDGEAEAVVYEGQRVSYGELNRRANQVAHYLREQGVKGDTLVGLCVERSVEMVVGILGILKAGGAYVPLDPGYPQERLEYMLEDSGPAVVLTQSWLEEKLGGCRVPVLRLDAEQQKLEQYAETNPERGAVGLTPNHLAYVIYTSGSTGQPKGVMVEHRQVQRLLAVTEKEFGFGTEDVWTLFHSYAFDFSVWELWGALAYGGRLVVVPHWVARSPEEFYQLLQREKVTVLNQTPTAFTQLSQVNAREQQRVEGKGEELALRVVVFGGEALKLSELQGWVERHGDEQPQLVNMYGITETTVHVTYRRIRKQDIESGQGSVIGRALGDLQVYVLNGEGELAPVGTAGEMYVGGAGVARGYLRREELTRERFVENRFSGKVSGKEKGRLYRTGDVARWLEGGELEYLGRMDDQVKIRGFRIELGEIEEQLAAIAGVNAAVVVAREGGDGQKRLVAYLAMDGDIDKGAEGKEAEEAERIARIRRELQQRLPDYMVPAAFVVLEKLPLTGNGKVDRKALPEPEGLEAHTTAYVAPSNAVEQALCEVWQEVLRQERVGIEDNFFSLGGDSILSIRVVSMLKSRGMEINVKDIFQHQTIQELAARVRLTSAEAERQRKRLEPFALLSEAERAAAIEAGYEDAYPMSALQTGMVFHTQLEQFSGIYHDILGEHVKCMWERGSFEQALAACIEENPILRTGFRLEGERPLQHVHARINLPLEIQDLRPMSAGEQEQHIAEWRERRKRQVFEWESGPLFHIHIFLRTEESFEFVMSFHHAVLDGWSRAALTTVLYNRYERLLRGELLEPVKVDWTYREFIAEEQQVVESVGAKEHFLAMLEEAPAEQLPRVKAAAGVNGEGREQEHLEVSGMEAVSGELLRLAKQMGVPLQSVLLAGHFKVLSLVSGQRRAVSCVTHNGRPEAEGGERSLGLYLNSLPVSVEVGGGTWRELIERVAEVGSRSMEYRSYPLSKIQQDTGMELGEVTFNYTHFHVYGEISREGEQQLEVLGSTGFEQTNFDFHMSVGRDLGSDELRVALIYNGAKFERELMERMSGYYVRAYEQMLGGLDEPHQGRTLLSGEEEEQIRSWNETAVEYERASVQEQFEQQARRTPEAVAVVCGGKQLSYAELNGKAERLARYLVEAGVERESRVGICLGRSLEMMIGMLGVLKAGGAYVPLEPGLPKVRLQYMLEDAGIEWVLVESTGMEKLPLGGVDVVLMDGAGEDERWLEEVEIGGEGGEGGEGGQGWEKPEVRAEDLAYILYTSGSTGEPKGVMVEHGGLANYVGHAVAEYLQGGNRASNKDNKGEIAEQGSRGGKEIVGSVVSTPLCFDATLTVLLPPLMVGKRVELLEEGEGVLEQLAERLFAGVERGAKKNKKNVDEKAEDGSESHAGWLFKITPAHLEALEYVERPRAMSEAGHCIVIGGEQLGAQRLLRWKRELLPNAVFVNEYGPTETVVGCSVWKLEDEAGERELEGQVAAPIGKPIGNTELYVVGEGGQLQPVNSVGELWIGGGGVGRGYVGREELTRERFVEDRFSGKEKGRLYRSGDLVRRLNHGELQFVGRRDDQVKVRGYRIELGEIEQQIAGLAGVAGAAVVVREDGGGEKRLVAYIVAEAAAGRQELETGEIRQQLQQRLPEYMVPHVYVRLEKLPLTGNGKVDRKALPAVEGSELQNSQYVGPRNEVERVLCGIWAEVLKRERVGVKDNFFSLGGDSILSIRVVSMLKGQGLVIGIREIFQHQTIEQLAQQVRSSSVETEPKRVEAFGLLTEEERALLGEGGGEKYEDAYPMSALQVGMVFHTQLEQFNGIYHDINAEHVKCLWDRNSFEQALAACIEEQPILRTGFLLGGERPLQVVHRGRVELPLGVEDLREMSEGEQQRCMAEWRERRKRHVFAWESGPLFHIQIFLRTEESFEFVISFHHAVLDGWSRAALGTMLYQRYERLLRGEELGPVEVDWTYREFIAEEQKVLGRQEAREHFAGMLEEAPVEQLPRKKSHSASATAAETGAEAGVLKQGRLQVEGFSEVSGRLIELARQLGVPVQVVLLAAHYKVLSLVSGQKRVVSCVIQNGRPETTGAERSLGLYLNSLPQAVEVKRSSWRELIHQVAELNAASLEYRRYPLAQIQQELGWAYSEVLFNYTHFHIYNELSESAEQARQAGANVLEGLGSTGFEQTNFDLLVDVSRGMNDERMWLALVYNAGVLEEGWMKRLGQYFVRACEQMLEHLEEAHEGEKLLGAEELEQLLAGWNATEVEYWRDACLQELFEEQVERDGEAEAVVYEGQRVSYGELNRRANQVAHYLREQGVKGDTLVGLCVERSVEMVVGILGILKAGGAYVPLDPGYPQERLEYMLEDSGPAVVLTQSWLEEKLGGCRVPVLRLDAEQQKLEQYAETNPERGGVGLTPNHLAYVIYTSGSTGQPKGVMNEHAGVVNRLLWARDEYQLNSSDRILQKTPYSFDVSVWEFLLPLIAGARLVVARPGGHLDPQYLAEMIEQEGITTVHFVPSMLQAFVEHGELERCVGLKRVLCSGEALGYGLQERFQEALPEVELHNLYGPTEAAIDVTSWVCRRGVHEGIVPIGRPIANTQIYILDGEGELAPAGVAGEIYLGGAGLARGYLRREELTRERFVADRFREKEKGRLYRTGDLGRWLEDGAIEYLGRNDFQVKIRGFRIELGEIEERLQKLNGVRNAAVLAREDEPGQKRLVAYVVLEEGGSGAGEGRGEGEEISEGDLIREWRRDLQTQLPEYMVPGAFVILQELPLSANGKLDRKALPAPEFITKTNEYVAPVTDTEIVLVKIWADLLKLDPAVISTTANLFEMGGHSLMLIKLASEIRSEFGVELSIRDLIQHLQLNSLAELILETSLTETLIASSEYKTGNNEVEVTI